MSTTLTKPGVRFLNGQRPPTAIEPAARRNRTRIALGLLLLVLCVLAVVTLYAHASQRRDVLAVRRSVAAGHPIAADDLATVSISADATLRTVAATGRSGVVGKVAAVALVPGSLLSPNQIADGRQLPAGMVVTGATLKAGQYPLGLRPGDRVLLVEIPAAATASVDPIERGNAQVLGVEPLRNDPSALAVALVVPVSAAPSVAIAGAAGRLAVVVVEQP